MKSTFVFTAAALAAALSMAAMPADAQDRRGAGRERARGTSVQGGGERESRGRQAVPRSSASRQYQAPASSGAQQVPRYDSRRQAAVPQQAPRTNTSRQYQAPAYSGAQQAPRYNAGRQAAVPQQAPRTNTSRQYQAPAYSGAPNRPGGSQAGTYRGSQRGPASYGNAAPRPSTRGYGGYQSQGPRYDDRRGYARSGGGYGRYETRRYARPPHFQPYRPLYFSRPYYGFRPHVHVGFGVWLGVTVPYPWAYFGTYRPRVYGYYDRTYYGAAPGMYQYGGLSFDIQPSDADLWVDSEYVGPVGTFTPYGEPLTLWPGVHHIAIVREGFRTMEWEVTVEPGRVIPYRGMLARW